ncbi:MAG: hypothetical protein AB1898_10335 [Acidobacteriota bacterium]
MNHAISNPLARMRSKRLILLGSIVALTVLFYLVASGRLAAGRSTCSACQRPLHKGQIAIVVDSSGKESATCCPRCGLRFAAQTGGRLKEVTDFATGQTLPAGQAYYLEGSDVMECCSASAFRSEPAVVCELHFDRCLPSLIAFDSVKSGIPYARRHGGHWLNFEGAQTSVLRQMGKP